MAMTTMQYTQNISIQDMHNVETGPDICIADWHLRQDYVEHKDREIRGMLQNISTIR